MNGARGVVKGFMWREGGDPGSNNPQLRLPEVIFVDFEDIRMKDAAGNALSFFPGDPVRRRWVPIFPHECGSSSEQGVKRKQYPLMLAWALTVYKAQGMNLRRVLVRLSAKTATSPGVAFVACTRVRHPRHMVFDTDLPSYEDFMAVTKKPDFRARARFELRMYARASRTSRRWGFCEADPWTRDEAAKAEDLLTGLTAVRATQRAALEREGVNVDGDTWCWPGGKPNCEKLLQSEAVRLAAGSEGVQRCYEAVVQKLLDRQADGSAGTYLHLAAVEEALGCLIPEELHKKLDGRIAKGVKAAAARQLVNVFAGKFSLDLFKAQALREENRLVTKDVFEFFLIVARHLCRVLDLPVVISSHKLGHTVGTEHRMEQLLASVTGWPTWRVDEVRAATEWMVPVCVNESGALTDWVLVRVTADGAEGGTLGSARGFVVEVTDRSRRPQLANRLATAVMSLLRGAPVRDAVAAGAQVRILAGPPAERRQSMLAVLGLVMWQVAARADVEERLRLDSARFVADVRSVADRAFCCMRDRATAVGVTDVLACFGERERCVDLLKVFGSPVRAVDGGACVAVPKSLRVARAAQQAGSFEPRVFLTWNICAALDPGKAARAPATWSRMDNLLAMQAFIGRRWRPDVLALQECRDEHALPELLVDYVLLGATRPSSAEGAHVGSVHLYARRGLDLAVQELGGDVALPCVFARGLVDGVDCQIVAAHLGPHRNDAAKDVRARQVAEIMLALDGEAPAQARVLMGDLNMDEVEVQGVCEKYAVRDADYAGMSWDPRSNPYDGRDVAGTVGYRFDRVLFSGALWSHGVRVGDEWMFEGAEKFRLSDHYAVYAVVDFHEAYAAKTEAMAMLAEARRGMVAGRRDDFAVGERLVVAQNEAAGQAERVLQAQRLSDEEVKKQLRARRREEESRRKALKGLREALYGPAGCFGDGAGEVHGVMPEALVRAQDVAVPGLGDVSGAEASVAWSRLVLGRYPRSEGLCTPDKMRSYAVSLVQVLLRVPALAVWLTVHARSCSAAGTRADGRAASCVTCSLWRTREHLGLRAVPDVMLHLAEIGVEFKERRGHDVVTLSLIHI